MELWAEKQRFESMPSNSRVCKLNHNVIPPHRESGLRVQHLKTTMVAHFWLHICFLDHSLDTCYFMAALAMLPCILIVSVISFCHLEDWDFMFCFLCMYPPYLGCLMNICSVIQVITFLNSFSSFWISSLIYQNVGHILDRSLCVLDWT